MASSVRGVYSFTVTNTVTGEVVQTGEQHNSVTQNWFDETHSNGIDYDALDGARIFAGYSVVEPGPYETRCADVVMVYLEHNIGVGKHGREEGTGAPYVEWSGLIQVFGSARTFNTLGMMASDFVADQDVNPRADVTSHFSRVKLETPIEQGADDQVSVVYRIYFDVGVGQSAAERDSFAGHIAGAAANRLSGTNFGAMSSSWRLSQVGDHCWNGRGAVRDGSSSSTWTNFGTRISGSSFGTGNFAGPVVETPYYNFTRGVESQIAHVRTGTDYFLGVAFNNASPENAYGFTPRHFLQKKADNNGSTTDQWFQSLLDLIPNDYGLPVAKTSTGAIDGGDPFKNVFMHTADDFKVVYNPNKLPTGTWVPTFSGTWAADDHTPLLTRCWVDTAGPVNGTATYKMNFARFGSFQWGIANDEYYTQIGTSYSGGSYSTSGNVDHQFFGPDQLLQTSVDPDWYPYTTGDNDSSFGNFGFSGGNGWYLNHTQPPSYSSNSTYAVAANIKRFTGLDTNSWWGWSYSPEHLERAGVQFVQMLPEATRQWKMAEIGCSRIDWVEHIKGLPGEVDDEQVLVVDSTSGIYRINYTQNTVTQVTSETGFLYCSYSRDYSSGIEEIIAYKLTDNGDGTFTGSMHSNLISAFAGTDADFWASVPGGAPTWWTTHNDRIVGVRKHYRHPRHIVFQAYKDQANTYVDLLVLAGDMATGTWYDWENSARNGSDSQHWFYCHENHLLPASNASVPDAIKYTDMTVEDFRRMTLWQDWAQFHPDGQYVFIKSMYYSYGPASARTWIVNSCPGDAGFYTSASHEFRAQGSAFAPTHNLVKLEQADGSHCYAWGDLTSDTTYTSFSYSTSTSTQLGDFIFAPTRSDQQATVPGYKQKWVIHPHSIKHAPHQSKSSSVDTMPASVAEIKTASTGEMPGYKGVTSDGYYKRFAPMYTPRDHSSITSASLATLYTHPGTGTSEIDSWPIDGENDTNILNPRRWDVFGWDATNSVWVKEQWYWNYDTEIWTLDPATAFPGKPIPSDGSTELLSDYGITEYPYAGLEITWEDKRPANSVAPSFADHSTQVIYNGCFLDGVTEYGISVSQGRSKMEPVSFSGTVDDWGFLKVPYQGPEYGSLAVKFAYLWNVVDHNGNKLDWNYDTYSTLIDPIDTGTYGVSADSVHVADDLIGTTLTVNGFKYTLQDDPLSYGNASYLVEQMPTTAGGLKSPLSGDVGVALHKQDILDDGTWTEIAPNGTSTTSIQWIDSTIAPFDAYFPNGVPTVGGRFTRYLVWQPYWAGFIHSDDNDMIYNYNYNEIEDIQTDGEKPPTNGAVFGFETTQRYPYNNGFFYKQHTDAEGREWLVVLCKHAGGSSATSDNRMTYEIWYPKLAEGQTFEVRWQYYVNSNNPNYTGSNAAYYMGFHRRDVRGEFGSRQALIGPYGFSIADSWSYVHNDSYWGAHWKYQGQRMCFDMRPTKDSFASLILPPAS